MAVARSGSRHTVAARLWACLLAGALTGPAGAIDATGTNTGAIPDNDPAGRVVSFNLAGMTSPVTSVEVQLDLTHTFTGDLTATLRSPGGLATLVILGRTGVQTGTNFGASANLGGLYRFDDGAPGDLKSVALPLATGATVPPGRYRTSTAGVSATLRGGCSTWLRGAFAGLAPAQANGTWTLTIADAVSSDTGSINAALLRVRGSQDDLFGEDFDAPVAGTCRPVRMDYTGTGRSSYVLVRNTGGGPTGAITWFVRSNDGTVTGAISSFVHGNAADRFTDGDFDGDGITDAVFWRSGEFHVRRSSRPGDDVLVIPWGQAGDDPTHSGDYDGDRISDVAVYRPGASSGDVSRTLIRPSAGGPERNFVTGQNGQFASAGDDYTGDGRADIAIQSNAGGGNAAFNIFDGSTGVQAATFLLGLPTSVIVLGNHVGSERGDFTVIRGTGGQIEWVSRDGATGTVTAPVLHGVSATDFPVTGDYDGDGLDDYAVWRPSATPDQSRFFIRRSGAPDPVLEVPLGQNGDYPVANNRTH